MKSSQEYISCSKLFLLDNGIFLVCFDSNSMKTPGEVEKYYYREVGTFIDLVCQREMSCAKIILVATKADGEQSQPSSEVVASILQRTKDHISYLFGPDSEPVVDLFDQIVITSSKDASSANGQDMLRQLHKVITAMVTKVNPMSKGAIPRCWIKWLQKLRELPSAVLTDLKDLQGNEGPVNIPEDDVTILKELQMLLESDFKPAQQRHQDMPDEQSQRKGLNLLEPTLKAQALISKVKQQQLTRMKSLRYLIMLKLCCHQNMKPRASKSLGFHRNFWLQSNSSER